METQTKTEVNVQQAVPFFMVSSMEASLRFYVDGLGFAMTKKWTPDGDGKVRWCWLELGNTALMLQEFKKGQPPYSGQEGKLGMGVSVCFTCQDALKIYREIKGRGVEADRPFVGNSMWVTCVRDPDGYRLDFESYTDAPEESVLPED